MLSGIASELWPGKGIDKRRFVQSWVQFSEPNLSPNLISVPLLAQQLRDDGKASEAQTIENARPEMFGFGNQTVILNGKDVDASELEIVKWVPVLELSFIRRFSYPAVFYEHVRSSLFHEWKLSPKTTGIPMTSFPAGVSYVNRLDTANMAISRRVIHFHMEWLADVVRSIAANSANLITSGKTLSLPTIWWIEGG